VQDSGKSLHNLRPDGSKLSLKDQAFLEFNKVIEEADPILVSQH
jgi:hypothetical protein